MGVITPGVFHTLAITSRGPDLGRLRRHDGHPGDGLDPRRGRRGARRRNQPITFDDVAVTSGSTTLFADDFGPKPLAQLDGLAPGPRHQLGRLDGRRRLQRRRPHAALRGRARLDGLHGGAKVRLANAADYPGGLRGRVNTATGGSYAAWIYPGQGKIKLWRNSAWHVDTAPTTMLAEANVSIPTERLPHPGDHFPGNPDHRCLQRHDRDPISRTPPTPRAPWPSTFRNQPIDYDDVSVTGAPPPPTSLFADDFAGGLAGWTPSPLGLFSNWSGASGTAAYNGGGHTQIYAGNACLDGLQGRGQAPPRERQQPPRRHPRPGEHTTGEPTRPGSTRPTASSSSSASAAWNIDSPGIARPGPGERRHDHAPTSSTPCRSLSRAARSTSPRRHGP